MNDFPRAVFLFLVTRFHSTTFSVCYDIKSYSSLNLLFILFVLLISGRYVNETLLVKTWMVLSLVPRRDPSFSQPMHP